MLSVPSLLFFLNLQPYLHRARLSQLASHSVLMWHQQFSNLIEWAAGPTQIILLWRDGKGQKFWAHGPPQRWQCWWKPERNCFEVLAPASWVSCPGTVAKAAMAVVWATLTFWIPAGQQAMALLLLLFWEDFHLVVGLRLQFAFTLFQRDQTSYLSLRFSQATVLSF